MPVVELKEIVAYTDGSCDRGSKTAPGGWAFRILYGTKCYERFGCKSPSTSNEMELTAILRVLQFVKLTIHPLTVYCVSPEVPILKADLSYVLAGELRNGDSVFGFEDNIGNTRNRRSQSGPKIAVVTNTTRGIQPLIRIVTSHSTVVVSRTHPFLVTPTRQVGKDRRGRFRWKKANELVAGLHQIVSLGPTWGSENTRSAGWLADIFDGEGCCNKWQVGFTQKPGFILDRVLFELEKRGFVVCVPPLSLSGVGSLYLNGGFTEHLRFLGTIRPERLVNKQTWTQRKTLVGLLKADVLSVEPLGMGEVVELSTSTRTFVAAGLLSHNTDSQYARNALTLWIAKWRTSEWTTALGDPVCNLDLMKKLDLELQSHYAVRTLEIKWLRGHCEKMTEHHSNNCRVDGLAGLARVNHQTNWTQPQRKVKVVR